MTNIPVAPDMTDWTDESAWAGTRAPLRQSTGLNPSAYVDERFFALEQELVFERAWVTVGVAGEVAVPGRMLVRQVGQKSIVITCGEDGELRGFLNSCRHRGTELAEADCDIAATIRCPYHRWGYGTDGSLKATPFFDEVPRDDFDRDDLSLLPVRVGTWGPLLLACLSDETPELDVWLGDLPERMAGYGFDQWRIEESQVLDIKANWKLISENFQEYYHLTWVHPELVLPAAEGLDESDATSGRHIALYPNVIFSVLPNHVFVMRLDPIAPGLTRETCTFLLPPSTPELTGGELNATLTFWIDVNNEDIDICQRSQRGLSQGRIRPGPLAPRFEEPLHRFHNMLADCMTSDSLAGLTVPPGDDGSEAARLGTGPNPAPPTIER